MFSNFNIDLRLHIFQVLWREIIFEDMLVEWLLEDFIQKYSKSIGLRFVFLKKILYSGNFLLIMLSFPFFLGAFPLQSQCWSFVYYHARGHNSFRSGSGSALVLSSQISGWGPQLQLPSYSLNARIVDVAAARCDFSSVGVMQRTARRCTRAKEWEYKERRRNREAEKGNGEWRMEKGLRPEGNWWWTPLLRGARKSSCFWGYHPIEFNG